jgi:hypothetical protein
MEPEKKFERVAIAVIIQAIRDARGGGKLGSQAQSWLCRDGYQWLGALEFDIDPRWWLDWVDAGCPAAETNEEDNPEKRVYLRF